MSTRLALAAALILASTSAAAAAPAMLVGHVSGYALVALNPQPEPPGVTDITTSARVSPGSRVALNPQPEPPGFTTDVRRLPPGPCSTLRVTVAGEGQRFSALAKPTSVAGKCSFDVAVPNAAAGSKVAVKFSRDR